MASVDVETRRRRN